MAPSRISMRNLTDTTIASAAAEGTLSPVDSEHRVACSSLTQMRESATARIDISSGLEAARVLNDEDARVREPSAIASQVAGVMVGIATIGQARDALRQAGFDASIAGNRISVGKNLSVQYLGVSRSAVGSADPVWVVFASASEPPTFVGAMKHQA